MTLERTIKQFLEDRELRFTKIRYKTKRPIEKNWPNRPYTYQEILNHIQHQTNYGVLTGIGNLVVADADSKELAETIDATLPNTFTVQTGSGGRHYYYKSPELQKRIILQTNDNHHGEIQSKGQAVVGPGSIHPTGTRYEIISDAPIITVNISEIRKSLYDFIPQKPNHNQPIPIHKSEYSHLNQIPITTVIDITNYKKAPNGEYYGPNPWHGSTTGMNTWVNIEKNVAYCFRHNAGISVAKAVALNKGLIRSCDSGLPPIEIEKSDDPLRCPDY